MSTGKRIPRVQALPIVEELAQSLQPHCEELHIAGSIRREKGTIGDVELVAIPLPTLLPTLDKMLADGVITHPARRAWGSKQRKFIYRDMQIDLYLADAMNAGFILWLRTGDNDPNHRGNQRVLGYIKRCEERAVPSYKPGFKIEGGYVLDTATGEMLAIRTEQDWFDLLGIELVAPVERNGDAYLKRFKAQAHQWGDVNRYRVHQGTQECPQDHPMQLALALARQQEEERAAQLDEGEEDFSKIWLPPSSVCFNLAAMNRRLAEQKIGDPYAYALYVDSAERWQRKGARALRYEAWQREQAQQLEALMA